MVKKSYQNVLYVAVKRFYSNIKLIISEVIKPFNKLFGRDLIFDTKRSIKITGFGISRKFCGLNILFFLIFFFNKRIDNTVKKLMRIVSC